MHGRPRWLAEEKERERERKTKYPNKTTSKCLDVVERKTPRKNNHTQTNK